MDRKGNRVGESSAAADDNAQIIKTFIGAWSRLDAKKLASYFCDDGCYYNMPVNPVKGRDNVQQFIASSTANWTATDWEIVYLVAECDVLFCERVDRTQFAEGGVDLPCLGVFEISL
ncbi:MAG: limonene-1,2-epoxide hydrolase family protein [Pseudomonadota bacterium]|nr:limonene-1,2-epoxide hydrolase family protein [Pseudomonadota bacterium]